MVWHTRDSVSTCALPTNEITGGFHGEEDRPKGGSYTDGYRYVGYFFDWLRRNKDKDFIRKINRSCLEVIPWSWDAAMSYALGRKCSVDELWNEYQVAVGDKKG